MVCTWFTYLNQHKITITSSLRSHRMGVGVGGRAGPGLGRVLVAVPTHRDCRSGCLCFQCGAHTAAQHRPLAPRPPLLQASARSGVQTCWWWQALQSCSGASAFKERFGRPLMSLWLFSLRSQLWLGSWKHRNLQILEPSHTTLFTHRFQEPQIWFTKIYESVLE